MAGPSNWPSSYAPMANGERVKQPPIFVYEGRDALAQFLVWLAPLLAGGVILMMLLDFGSVRAVVAAALLTALAAAGLRSSICVTEDEVTIVRKWFFVPYWRHRGREIQDVWYGGDAGMPEGAMGVVVKVGNKEIHIGTAKSMHELHHALYRLSAAYRGPVARNVTG